MKQTTRRLIERCRLSGEIFFKDPEELDLEVRKDFVKARDSSLKTQDPTKKLSNLRKARKFQIAQESKFLEKLKEDLKRVKQAYKEALVKEKESREVKRCPKPKLLVKRFYKKGRKQQKR